MTDKLNKKDIRERVEKILRKDLNDFNTPFYQTVACYYLWVIKSDDHIVTPKDMLNYIEENEHIQFPSMSLDDLLFEFEDKPEVWNEFAALKDLCAEKTLEEIISDVDQYDLGDSYDPVPKGVASLLDHIIEINSGDSVLQMQSGAGEFLHSVYEMHKDVSYTCYEEAYGYQTAAAIIADVQKDKDVAFVSEVDGDLLFDKAVVTTAIGPWTSSSDPKYDFDDDLAGFPSDCSVPWNQSVWAVRSLKKKGKAVSIMNGGQLTVKQTESARAYMCNKGYIEGVITLPNKLYSNIWVSPYLLILGHGNKNVRFMDASSFYEEGRLRGKRVNILTEEAIAEIIRKYKSGEDVAVVPCSKLAENGYNLNPSRYITGSRDKKDYVMLGDLVENIRRGMSLKASQMDELITMDPSDNRCIIPSSISAGVVQTDFYYHGAVKKNSKNLASHGDVLISKTGTPYKIAVSDGNYVVVGNVYILEIKNQRIRPEYISCYLSSKKGQEELSRFSIGAATPVLNISDLYKVRIPVYDDKTMKQMSEKAGETLNDIADSYKRITDGRREIDLMFE